MDALSPFRDQSDTPHAPESGITHLVHLQCHIGLDTLSWAGRGARASGLDFSVPVMEAARGLAANPASAPRS